ncbi:MAG: FHA domain-containing protein [Cryobacterium sp.]|nr:FHA domain-containing protein [Cryobacterium sp.]
MREDTEDTVIRARHPSSPTPASDADALADTVLRKSSAPPPLVEPVEPADSGDWKRALTGDLTADLPTTQPHAAPSRQASASPPSSAPAERSVHSIRVGGSEFSLEAPAFIGRHPSTPRIMGTRPVRLVRVPSPNREISSTHVSIQQEGSSVVVTDLGSTNGTTIIGSGPTPVPLRRGDSMVVLPGSLVDLGDSVVIEVLAAKWTADD